MLNEFYINESLFLSDVVLQEKVSFRSIERGDTGKIKQLFTFPDVKRKIDRCQAKGFKLLKSESELDKMDKEIIATQIKNMNQVTVSGGGYGNGGYAGGSQTIHTLVKLEKINGYLCLTQFANGGNYKIIYIVGKKPTGKLIFLRIFTGIL